MRIAIVGAGISGLAAAHMLHRRHEIAVFEAGPRPGGHANTVLVRDDDGDCALDTGFVVYNDRNYPCFERLLAQLSVASQPSDMSFGVSDGVDFEYNGASLNGLFANRAHLLSPAFHRMVAELLRFNREARRLLAADAAGASPPARASPAAAAGPSVSAALASGPSLGEWLQEHRFSSQFVQRLIVPQVSAVWSTDPRQMWSFPARFLAEFFDNHGMLCLTGRPRWRTIVGGSARYVQALVGPWRSALRLRTPVCRVRRRDDHVLLWPASGEVERFDHVVIATHSDDALRMLGDPSDAEREVLGAIPYSENEAVLHCDERMLPRRRRAWASWNYHLLDPPLPRPTVTYHLNRLQALSASRQFCVTLNRGAQIDPEKTIETFAYSHPVYTAEAVAAQSRWAQISGPRTHYCGAYWGWGFHEDGVVSALRATAALGGSL